MSPESILFVHSPLVGPSSLSRLADATAEAGIDVSLSWWPEETIADLVPDDADRVELEADLPRVPRSFYNRDVPVPPGWSERGCGYLMLSDAYEAERNDAAERRWPKVGLDSDHLAPHTQPEFVLRAILELAHRID